jgi:glycosyltransferase involved in cell wall biosynthesis
MLFTIIIPTCNRLELLSKCLRLLHPAIQNFDSNNYEIIVTDDSNNQSTKELIDNEYKWIQWVKGPRKGPAANRNNGAKYARAQWLIFLDDDILPHANLLAVYNEAIDENKNVYVFEGAIHPTNWEDLKKDMTECPININGNCFWSANICLNKKIFEKVGGFDERYFLAAQEDQQLKIDIEKITSITFLSNAIVHHPVKHLQFWKQVRMIPLQSKNFILFEIKNKTNYSIFLFIREQLKFHAIGLKNNISKKKARSSIISLFWIIFGVPLNVLYFLSYKKNNE